MVLESIFHLIFLGVTASGIIWRFRLKNRGIFFLEYESLCNLAEASYYFLQIIIEFFSLFKQNRENCLKNILKYTVFKILFAPIVATPFIFILGYYLKWFYFFPDLHVKEFWCDLITHIFAPACFLLDVIFFGRKYCPSNFLDLIIITSIYIAYAILCLPHQTNEVYEFITNGKLFVFSAAFVFYTVGMVMHFLYLGITKIRND